MSISGNKIKSLRMNYFIQTVVTALAIAICIIVLCGLIIGEVTTFSWTDVLLIPVSLVVLGGICIALLRSDYDESKIIAVILIVSASLRFAYVYFIPEIPQSDWAMLYEAAHNTVNGDLNWISENGYFRRWAYQIPYVFYQAGVLKIIPSLLALKIINVVWMVGSNYFVYRIAKEIATPKAAVCASFLYAVYPEMINTSATLLNSHISTFFFLFGLFCVIHSKSWIGFLFAGILLGVSNLMRPVTIIVVIALICTFIWICFQHPTRRALFLSLKHLLLILLGYYAITKGTDYILRAVGIAPYGIGNHFPEWQFILGLNFNSVGNYSPDAEYIKFIEDPVERNAEIIRFIKNSYVTGKNPLVFFGEKIYIQWCMFIDSSSEVLNRFGKAVNFAVYGCVWLFNVLSFAELKRGKTLNNKTRLLTIIILGYFSVYLFIEIAARYRYRTVAVVFIMAAVALSQFEQRLKNRDLQELAQGVYR